MRTPPVILLALLLSLAFFIPAHPVTDELVKVVAGDSRDVQVLGSFEWSRNELKAIDGVRDMKGGKEGGDILAFYAGYRDDGTLLFRVSFAQMIDPVTGEDFLRRDKVRVVVLIDYKEGGGNLIELSSTAEIDKVWDEGIEVNPFSRTGQSYKRLVFSNDGAIEQSGLRAAIIDRKREFLSFSMDASGELIEALKSGGNLDSGNSGTEIGKDSNQKLYVKFEVITLSGDEPLDVLEADASPAAYEANCAFVHHGNQGLAYSDVFHGRSDDPDGSGFDEALEVHEATGIPGNFHLAATLQTSAEWDNNNGDPVDFNGWLASGASAGWCGLVSSAYAQHIMPFVQNAMNDWAVDIETQMTDWRYGYYPRVAWVPERVWLNPSYYPDAGVIDDMADNWLSHGIYAVILDDDVHGQGYDNHQIHTLAGSSLKVMLRDRNFTGKIVGGDGAGALQILTDLANSGVGEYRIVLYAEDWEAVAEMGSWKDNTPNAKETYDWFINKCAAESSWINVWKVADAVSNPNFQGSTSMNPTYGTYWEIGGTDGYGGGNNGWYTHWAGYIPYANGGDGNGNCDPERGGNCKDFGTIWNDAYNALMSAPDNNISQAGWYVLMTNLHETGWHDYMGGPISGWELNYSSHIKNANIYAEASHWANGEYANTTGAYFSDIDNDGYNELIMHNDRVFAVFEGIGARATNIFAKGSDYNFSIVGVDNAYWSGTQADYNDANHVGALSDVGPNYQHSIYDMEIVSSSGSTVEAVFRYNNLTKRVKLTAGEPYLDVVYEVGPTTQYIQSGFSPGLVDLIWNAQMSRVWVSDAAYMGQRNPNNGATAALILGAGGASHNFDFSARIMKGDEIYGTGTFEFLLFAGKTSEPDVSGEISELRALSNSLTDTIGPGVVSSTYYPGTDRLKIDFNQVVKYSTFVVTGVSVDDDDDGVAELTLSSSTQVLETSNGYTITLELTSTDAQTLEGLNKSTLELMLSANTVEDLAGNWNNEITNEDDKKINYGAETSITIDGFIDTDEWNNCTMAVADSNDSEWTSANEIDALYVTWDSLYLYIALDGIVSANSWLIYFDTDPGGPNGETDLTAINYWERGAVFTAPGFRCDYQYGCYQHQGQYDSDSFFRIISATEAVNISDSILSAFDSMHNYGNLGGSELAIPWDLFYHLGPDSVPVGAQISIVASLCWDPEPDGVLGGDSAPNNISATLPTIDNVYTFTVDSDGDGKPDRIDRAPPAIVRAYRNAVSDSLVDIEFSEVVDKASAETESNYMVYESAVPSNSVAVVDAVLLPGGRIVQLALEHGIGSGYEVSVSFVADTSCYHNEIEPQSTAEITGPVTGNDDVQEISYAGRLYQNYPNPFNPSTVISFEVPGTVVEGRGLRSGSGGAVSVTLQIFDVNGRLVRTLVSEKLLPGKYSVMWDGRNDRGVMVTTGIYFYRLVTPQSVMTRKMVLIR